LVRWRDVWCCRGDGRPIRVRVLMRESQGGLRGQRDRRPPNAGHGTKKYIIDPWKGQAPNWELFVHSLEPIDGNDGFYY